MIPAFLILLSSITAATITGTHTDGSRHIAWQLDYPDGFDTTVAHPAFLEFHGDLGADEASVLQLTAPYATRWGFPHKAYAITFAGQDVSSEMARRLNGALDGPLMVAAIRSNLGGIIKIDTNQIVLHGMSSGGGFLDYVLQKQLFKWGGGTFIQCGIHNYMSDPIPPDTARARKYKVFVATSKDDFLYNSYHPILEHAKYWSGYDVRYSTAGSGGGHCSTLEGTRDSAVNWLFGTLKLDSGAYQQTFTPHWKGVSSLSGIKGVAATPQGALWAVASAGGKSQAYRSLDNGATWTSHWSAPDSSSFTVGGIAAFGETVVVSHLRKLVVIPSDPSLQFSRTISAVSPAMTSDGKRIWMKAQGWSWSDDTGRKWNSVPADWIIPDQIATGAWRGISSAPPHFVRKHDSTVEILDPNPDFSKADSVLPPLGRILSSTRRGDTLLATIWDGSKQTLHTRIGGVWTSLPWPGADGISADSKVAAIHQLGIGLDSRPLVMGRPSYKAGADGKWARMPGALSVNPEPTAYLADGRILRVSSSGFGLILWTPTSKIPAALSPPPPRTSSIKSPVFEGNGIRRIGSYLELPQQGGPWQVRWLDAAGNTRSIADYATTGLVPLRPKGAPNMTLLVEVVGAHSRMILPTVR